MSNYITNKSKEKLYRIAEAQQGLFTARQAVQAGYNEGNHPYHVNRGHWIKKARGIYRLRYFPDAPVDSELSFWNLWSCNKQGEPQAVYSHETALQIYDLSDLSPAKIHITVPVSFRKSVSIPKILKLYKDNLKSEEWREMKSFRVTTPVRTLYDIITSHYISREFKVQTVKEGLERGLFSTKELKKYKLLNLRKKIDYVR